MTHQEACNPIAKFVIMYYNSRYIKTVFGKLTERLLIIRLNNLSYWTTAMQPYIIARIAGITEQSRFK